MTTETLNKPTTTARSESPPKPVRYDTGYLPQPIEYPDSDGQPMAESDFQRKPLNYALESLELYFRSRSDVYVTGNIFLYFQEGEPAEVVAPDVFVVLGAGKHDRRFYKLWEEPKAPDFVLEITSKSTRSADQGSKKGTYEFLGVTEYFCYDPTGDYLKPPLRGFRLKEGLYSPIAPTEESESRIVLRSQTLGLDLQVVGSDFRFVDPNAGHPLLNLTESEVARLAAEARVRELEAQLAALQKSN